MKYWCIVLGAAVISAVLAVLIVKSLGFGGSAGIGGGVGGAIAGVVAIKYAKK